MIQTIDHQLDGIQSRAVVDTFHISPVGWFDRHNLCVIESINKLTTDR
jgi:hypothetical protein